jgi:hypothetical protein
MTATCRFVSGAPEDRKPEELKRMQRPKIADGRNARSLSSSLHATADTGGRHSTTGEVSASFIWAARSEKILTSGKRIFAQVEAGKELPSGWDDEMNFPPDPSIGWEIGQYRVQFPPSSCGRNAQVSGFPSFSPPEADQLKKS